MEHCQEQCRGVDGGLSGNGIRNRRVSQTFHDVLPLSFQLTFRRMRPQVTEVIGVFVCNFLKKSQTRPRKCSPVQIGLSGGQCRTRTCDLLLVSTGRTSNQQLAPNDMEMYELR